MTQWIKCSERLPDEPMHCLVWHSHGYMDVMSWGGSKFFCRGFVERPTHWQPLPEPPTEDEKCL